MADPVARAMLTGCLEGRVMPAAPSVPPPGTGPDLDPLAVIAVSAAPIVLEGRYRLLVGALWRLRHSRTGHWAFVAGWGALALALAALAARPFPTTFLSRSSVEPRFRLA